MLPGYRYMDSYPQPTHFGYFPTWGDAHPQRNQEPSKPPHGPWVEYPTPMEYHGFYPCCPPAYYPPFRPPHSHLPPPPPFSYHGPYPPYGGGFYPPPYQYGPAHFSVEQPQYEYDKEKHCCGCPNHVCKDKGGEKIEGKGHKEDSSPSLEIGNKYPYPFGLSPEYLKSKANDKASEYDPKKLNGWYPFDLLNNKPLRSHQEDDKSDKIRDEEDKTSQFPFPIFWFPGYDKLKELKNNELKESDTSPKAIEEQPVKLKIIPVNPPGNGDCGVKPQVMEETQGNKAVKDVKEKKIKEIQVKQVDENEKNSADKKAENQSSSPRKSSQPSSPQKSSKLPPVCLRVDPLPRKKNGNGKGTSRSPSPPGEKSRATKAATEAKSCSGTAEQATLENKAEKEKPQEINVSEPKEDINHSKEEVVESTKTANKEEKPVKKQFSTTEAAVLIQSFYRRHEVRKWEPLKKLKQIAKIREQVDEIKERVCTLESSVELQKEGKQRVLIGETIMSLLLQLDTIQGLLPSVRDIRKVVARELVCLQERLDSLVCTNAGGEEKHEVMNSDEVCAQKALPETIHSDRSELPETLKNPKEAESQFDVEEQHTAEAAKESTKSSTNIGSMNTKVGDSSANEVESVPEVNEAPVVALDKSSVEEVGSIQKANEASVDGIEELTEPTSVVNEKVESEIEDAEEVLKEERSCVFHGDDKSGVTHDKKLEDMLATCEPGAEHVVQERPQEVADISKPGGEHVVQELPREVADVTESGGVHEVLESPLDAMHSPEELPQGVLGASEFGAEDVQKSSLQGVPDALELDSKHVQKSQQGGSNAFEPDADISEPGGKHFVEVLPLGDPDASEVNQEHIKGLPKGVSDALEPNAMHSSELADGISDENQMTDSNIEDKKEHGLQELTEFVLGEGVQYPAREEKDDVAGVAQEETVLLLPSAENNSQKDELGGVQESNDHSCDEHINESELTSSTDNVIESQENEEATTDVKENGAIININKYEAAIDEDLCLESETPKSDLCEEATADKNVAQEVDMKEKELTGVENPLRLGGDDKKLLEENEKLREMIGKLLHEGKQQLTAISDLHGRVKDLERKLTKKKKLRTRRQKPKKSVV